MLSIDAGHQNCWFVYKRNTYAVVHILGIAAFFISTKRDCFQHQRLNLLKYAYSGALDIYWVRHFLYLLVERGKGCLHGRSPPLISILPVNSKIEIGGYHEEDQSAGLLPVLYKRYCC